MEQLAGRRRDPDDELLEAVDASYDTVVSKLPKKHRPVLP